MTEERLEQLLLSVQKPGRYAGNEQGSVIKGILMLLSYSLGLGIPFVISAVLIDQLKSAFNLIKSNYRIINLISGSLLVLVGVLMASGSFGKLLSLLS